LDAPLMLLRHFTALIFILRFRYCCCRHAAYFIAVFTRPPRAMLILAFAIRDMLPPFRFAMILYDMCHYAY